ncbi:hypothetical protein ABFY41_00190 [Acinetobacter haemolyticus]|uniref:hypothetical protein n=1 Tax=Acinetobacter haemolyticus TaxID=29430 RepID=UPI003D261522
MKNKRYNVQKTAQLGLKDTILETTITHHAPNNQIAYLDPNGIYIIVKVAI